MYCVLRLRVSCFVPCSAVNVDKVREYNHIIYIMIVLINNCRS